MKLLVGFLRRRFLVLMVGPQTPKPPKAPPTQTPKAQLGRPLGHFIFSLSGFKRIIFQQYFTQRVVKGHLSQGRGGRELKRTGNLGSEDRQ